MGRPVGACGALNGRQGDAERERDGVEMGWFTPEAALLLAAGGDPEDMFSFSVAEGAGVSVFGIQATGDSDVDFQTMRLMEGTADEFVAPAEMVRGGWSLVWGYDIEHNAFGGRQPLGTVGLNCESTEEAAALAAYYMSTFANAVVRNDNESRAVFWGSESLLQPAEVPTEFTGRLFGSSLQPHDPGSNYERFTIDAFENGFAELSTIGTAVTTNGIALEGASLPHATSFAQISSAGDALEVRWELTEAARFALQKGTALSIRLGVAGGIPDAVFPECEDATASVPTASLGLAFPGAPPQLVPLGPLTLPDDGEYTSFCTGRSDCQTEDYLLESKRLALSEVCEGGESFLENATEVVLLVEGAQPQVLVDSLEVLRSPLDPDATCTCDESL